MRALGTCGIAPESQNVEMVIWELPMRGWYKLNFDGYVHDNKAGTRFVIRSDAWALVEDDSVLVVVLFMLEIDIRVYERLLYGFRL